MMIGDYRLNPEDEWDYFVETPRTRLEEELEDKLNSIQQHFEVLKDILYGKEVFDVIDLQFQIERIMGELEMKLDDSVLAIEPKKIA